MAESNQQQQVSEGTGSNVQWVADNVAPAPGVVTQVRSETTTYATDGDRFVERHEVLAGPLGEEEGYVEKREGHLGVPSGGVVEEVEEGREIGLLEPEGKVDADEVEDEDEEGKADEVEGGEKEIGALDEDEETDVSAEAGGEGTKEPPHSLAETPEKKAETGPTATVAAEAAGEAPVRAAREQDATTTSTTVPVAATPEDDVSLIDSDRKRKAGGEHEDVEDEAKKQKGGEGEKRGRGRPAKGEANGSVKGGREKEVVEGTRRSTRSKGKSE